MNNHIEKLKNEIEQERNRLLSHPVYHNISDLESLQKFTETHVFAVWDFMSLLKSLQIALTSVSIPWMPVGSAETRYLINEIVLGEECDVDEDGKRMSHFELYLKSMHQMGANTKPIYGLIKAIPAGKPIRDAIVQSSLHTNVEQFLNYTFEIAENAPPHVKASVFTFGREDLIPSMFMKFLEKMHTEYPDKVSTFKYYIERHIEVDGDHHSHLAINMVSELCGDDESKWKEAAAAAKKALEMRYLLWDAIVSN
ncbi:MAG: DUF3050 domain-containing protein [Bacteroidota bacterium]|jgi:hypothetical protein